MPETPKPRVAVIGLGSMLCAAATFAAEPNFPITPQQRATAQRAAETGQPVLAGACLLTGILRTTLRF